MPDNVARQIIGLRMWNVSRATSWLILVLVMALVCHLFSSGLRAAAEDTKPSADLEQARPDGLARLNADEQAATPVEKKSEVVTAKAYLSVDRLPPGDRCEILVYLTIKEGWHINANPSRPKNFIPTTVKLVSKEACELGNLQFPAPNEFEFPGLKEPLHVYEGKVAVLGVVEVPLVAAGRVDEIELHVRYQACNDTSCQPPKTLVLKSRVQIAGVGQNVKSINEELFRAEKQKLKKDSE